MPTSSPIEFMPPPQLLIKLGSIIIHYKELTSSDGHYMDKVALDSLLSDEEVVKWIEGMDKMALLPKMRK